METLDDIDRERRRVKQRTGWRSYLRQPQTLKLVLALIPALTKFVQAVIELVKLMRE